jgi:hypothetical protein
MDEALSHAQAERFRTDWKTLSDAHFQRRLQRLYQIRDAVMLYPDAMPLAWQQFLTEEISRGESIAAIKNHNFEAAANA